MEFKEITERQFEKYANGNELLSFYQTKEWAKLKLSNGWEHYYVGLIDKDKIIGAALLLAKITPIGKKMFYSPRGFLIDYNNEKVLKKFTEEIKGYVRKHNGIFIKIDPYLLYKERDINGDVVDGGIDNSLVVENLKKMGYKHYGFNTKTEGSLQPRWMFVLDVAGKSEEELMKGMIKQTRKNVKKTLKMGLVLEEIGKEGLAEYKRITEHTGSRRGFIDRPLSYYENMFDALGDKLKIVLCYLDTDISINLLQKEIDEINSYSDVTDARKKELKELQNKIDEIKKLEEKYGKRICLAGSMFIECGSELLNLYGGGYDEFMKWNAMYAIQWYAIKYANKHGFKRYNFYGIEGNFKKENNPMYGVYEFKKGFGGNVVELIGEFDLVVNKFYYFLYKVAFNCYHKLKNIKNKKS